MSDQKELDDIRIEVTHLSHRCAALAGALKTTLMAQGFAIEAICWAIARSAVSVDELIGNLEEFSKVAGKHGDDAAKVTRSVIDSMKRARNHKSENTDARDDQWKTGGEGA